MARRESSLSFRKDRSTLITGGKSGVGLAFVILVRSEIGDTEIKRDVYDLGGKEFHFLFFFTFSFFSFFLFIWGFWFCCVSCPRTYTNCHCTSGPYAVEGEKGHELWMQLSVDPVAKQ